MLRYRRAFMHNLVNVVEKFAELYRETRLALPGELVLKKLFAKVHGESKI